MFSTTCGEIEDLHVEHLLAPERQELARQRLGAGGRGDDRVEIAAGRGAGGETIQREAGAADDDREQVVEVVRDAAGQPPDGVHLLRLTQLVLELPALGDVAKKTREHRRAFGRKPRDRELDREFGPVRAHGRQLEPPADGPTFAGLQVARQAAPVPLLEGGRDQERGQLPAHHVVAPVPENALRGPVELGDASAVVDGHDAVERGVEGGRLAGLALAQPCVGPVERGRADPRQRAEHGHRRGDQQRESELRLVPARPLPVQREPAEHDRHTERGRQKAAPDASAGRVARQRRHQPAIRAREQDAAGQEEWAHGGVQRHARVRGDPVERRDAVEVPDESRETDGAAREGQELGGKRSRARLTAQEEHRESEQDEGDRRVDAHAAG